MLIFRQLVGQLRWATWALARFDDRTMTVFDRRVCNMSQQVDATLPTHHFFEDLNGIPAMTSDIIVPPHHAMSTSQL